MMSLSSRAAVGAASMAVRARAKGDLSALKRTSRLGRITHPGGLRLAEEILQGLTDGLGVGLPVGGEELPTVWLVGGADLHEEDSADDQGDAESHHPGEGLLEQESAGHRRQGDS